MTADFTLQMISNEITLGQQRLKIGQIIDIIKFLCFAGGQYSILCRVILDGHEKQELFHLGYSQ
jgi:hypothetical protein